MIALQRSKQRGISLLGLLLLVGIVVAVTVVGAQLLPTVVEYVAVKKAVSRAAAGQSVAEVREIFDKAAAVDGIRSITSKDVEITKVVDKVVVSFSYEREIHLIGPAYLTLKYQGSSD
jgi:hypothetical protein